MRIVAVVIALLAASCAVQQSLPPAHERLVDLIDVRLQIGKEVAWAKFRSGAPIYDRKREASLLDALTAQGAVLRVPESEVRAFFAAQMEASRLLQQELIAGWRAGKPRPEMASKNLALEIRPRLDEVSRQMLVELRMPLDWSPEAISAAATELQEDGYSVGVTAAAIGCLPR